MGPRKMETQQQRAEQIGRSFSEFDSHPVDRAVIPQTHLDLVNRQRTSLFPWRGQFSPELIELLLAEFSSEGHIVVDPFVGSGTTLFECARKSLQCAGSEINPAAVEMSRTVEFANLTQEQRAASIRAAREAIGVHVGDTAMGGMFSREEKGDEEGWLALRETLRAILSQVRSNPPVWNIIANTVLRLAHEKTPKHATAILWSFERQRQIIEQLPYTESRCEVFHCDARGLPVESGTADLVLTSPPYINVFNYHQYCRPALELMGWDMLRVATSEFGANRKHRANRFLTVVQYAIDMATALREMRRVLRPDGRAIVVIGRESNVRGVSFRNGRIVGVLGAACAGLQLVLKQERKFTTRYGRTIYEDILHFSPADVAPGLRDEIARDVGTQCLSAALRRASPEVRANIESALDCAKTVAASPLFTLDDNRAGEHKCQQLRT